MKRLNLLFALFITAFSMAQTPQISIVEHFTNTRCSFCASRNPAMFNVLEQNPNVMHISYHPSSPYSNCLFSLHNPEENDERTNFYGIYGGTPRVVLNGEVLASQNPMIKQEDLDDASELESAFSIVVNQMEVGSAIAEVNVVVEKLSESSMGNLSLYVALAENEIQYNAPNGEDVHHRVFRLKLAEEEVSEMSIGETMEFNYSYNFHSDWEMDEMFAYAILQNESKMVVQAAKSGLYGAATGIENHLVNQGLLSVYPNPVSHSLHFNNSSEELFQQINIYNVHAQLVLSQAYESILQIEELKAGIYIVQLQAWSGKSQHIKIQKL